MSRKPSSYNNASQLKQFTDTAYDNVVIVAEHIDEIIALAGGIDIVTLYLGAFTVAPTEGHDGAPLVAGNFYLNTTTGQLEYYDDTPGEWVAVDTETVIQAAQDAQAAQAAAELAQTGAETAETSAASSALAASNSESNAATSETNALNSANAAALSETNAQNSENAAKASETAAAQSEANAATSETNAASSASAAATSEFNASQSEANAETSEIASANFATIAGSHAANAEAAFDNFNDLYLGAFAVDPTTDNDGNPLQVGATYWNSTEDEQRFWSGASWDVPSDTAIQAANTAVAARDDAQISETNAAASAAAASTSESNAATSEANALASEQAAALSESNAGTSASNAATSETNAATSASNAATSETNAAQSAADAEQSYQDTLAVVPALQSQIDNRTTYADVGIPNDDSAKAAPKITGGSGSLDWDTLDTPGFWNVLSGNTSPNRPSGGTGYHYPWIFGYGSTGNVTQVAWPYGVSGNNGKVSYRTKFSGVFNPWVDFYTTNNKPSAQDVGAYTTAQVDSLLAGKSDTGHTHTEADITDLDKYTQAQVDALDAQNVKITGDQAISGNKEFTQTLIAASIEEALGSGQGLLLFAGGSTRIGGSGSAAGIQVRPNGVNVVSDTDYFSFQPGGLVEYEGASNFGVSRAGGSHGTFAYADGRTFLTAGDNSIELRPKGLADSSKSLLVGNTGAVIQKHSGGPAYRFQDAVASGVGSSSYFEWTHSDEVRRGFIGYGSSANNNMTWFNDEGNNSVVLLDTGEIRFTPGTAGYVNNTKDTAFNTKVVHGGTSDAWLRLNPYGDFTDGIFCGSSLLRTDGQITSGSWSGTLRAARVASNFIDSGWGTNGTAAFSLNQADSPSAHWAFASYYDGVNIRSGIQILSNTDGRMRLWTDRLAEYAEIYNGGIRVTGAQLSDTNALTRKDYVDGVTSDERLKSNIKSVDDALSIVNKVPVHTYLKEVKERNEELDKDEVIHKYEYGFIAQEVEKVLPHLVKESEDGIKLILRTGNDLHALSFRAIQQLSESNSTLRTENRTLRSEVDELKSELALIKKHLGL